MSQIVPKPADSFCRISEECRKNAGKVLDECVVRAASAAKT